MASSHDTTTTTVDNKHLFSSKEIPIPQTEQINVSLNIGNRFYDPIKVLLKFALYKYKPKGTEVYFGDSDLFFDEPGFGHGVASCFFNYYNSYSSIFLLQQPVKDLMQMYEPSDAKNYIKAVTNNALVALLKDRAEINSDNAQASCLIIKFLIDQLNVPEVSKNIIDSDREVKGAITCVYNETRVDLLVRHFYNIVKSSQKSRPNLIRNYENLLNDLSYDDDDDDEVYYNDDEEPEQDIDSYEKNF